MADRLRAVPAWAWLARDRRRSRSSSGRWLARGMLGAVHHGRRARSTPSWRRASPPTCTFAVRGVPAAGYGVVYPLADRARVRALRPRPGRVRGGQDDQRARRCRSPPSPPTCSRGGSSASGSRSLAALLAVAVPSMVYTATVMTENAFYPVFLLAALALVRAARAADAGAATSPSSRRSALAYLTRVAGGRARPRQPSRRRSCSASSGAARCGRRSGPYRWLYAIVVGGARARRRRPGRARAAAERAARRLRGRRRGRLRRRRGAALLLYHLAELDLYLGVIPFAAAIVLTARARSLDRAAAGAPRGHARARRLVRSSSSARSRRGSPTGSRSGTLFVVAPLFLILLLAWVERGAPRPRDRVAPPRRPRRRCSSSRSRSSASSTTSAVSDTLMLLPWWAILSMHWRIDWLGWLAFLGAVALRGGVPVRAARATRSSCR